jgi:type III secretory pathway component EscU
VSQKREKYYPLACGAVITAAYLLLWDKFAFVSRTALTGLFTAVVSVSAIAVGFLATAESILLSLESKRVMKFLKEANSFNALVDYMMSAIHLSFALAAFSAFALLVGPDAHLWWYKYAFALWLFVLSTASFSYYRIVSIFAKILRSPD